MKGIIPLGKFKRIMNTLIQLSEKRTRISNFIEKEVATDSRCYVTFGQELEDILVKMLADEFECWYTLRPVKDNETGEDWWKKNIHYGWSNDIEYWLYDFNDDEKKTITVNSEEIDITSLEDFYSYLINQLKRKEFDMTLTK